MNEKFGLLLITGKPGVGKTTLVRKVCEDLVEKHKILCKGFYTEEIRNANSNERMGFDIVGLNQTRGILARLDPNGKGPYVGKYCVHVKDFEDLTLPLLSTHSPKPDLLVIDEVGKMELKSKKFEVAVKNCIMKTVILATVPYELRQPLALVDQLKNYPNAQIIVVTRENRNRLKNEVMEILLKLIKK